MHARTTNSSRASIFAFPLFAAFLSLRDILADYILAENATSLAWLVCTCIALYALLHLLATRKITGLARKVFGSARFFGFAALLSVFAAAIYWITFALIQHHKMGAGLFNVVDYGLSPILTAMLGYAIWKEQLLKAHVASLLVYVAGILLLYSSESFTGQSLILIALMSPFATAASDAISKVLLKNKFSREEVLLIRFAPASALLFALAYFSEAGPVIVNWPAALVVAILGVLAIWFLYDGLAGGPLTYLAVWETSIPALVFLGTLPKHLHKISDLTMVSGVGLIIAAVVLGNFADRFARVKKS